MSVGKKIVMSLVATVVFFGVLEVVLALVGIEPRLYSEDPYVGFSSQSPLFTSNDSGTTYRTAANKLTLFNEQVFRMPKDEGVTRIFCMGGSTTNGRPYDDATSFCGWLRELLPVADPSRQWELINAGGVSYASYRVALLMEELVSYEPDLFIIYSGQNEFLEERTYREIIRMPRAVRGLGALAARTRTHAMVNGVVEAVRKNEQGTEGHTMMSESVNTLLDSSVGPEQFTRDDVNQGRIIDHYRFNLARMVDIASSANAAALLVVPASNLADCTPFKAEHRADLEDKDRQEFEQAVAQAQESLATGDAEAALKHLDAAQAIDDRFSGLSFFRGRTLLGLGRFEEARAAFEQARDNDVCPLRILSPMEVVVREVAGNRRVPLVDFARIVDENSTNGIPGRELFLDHVHPTIEGNLLLARSIVDGLSNAGLMTVSESWSEAKIAEVAETITSKIDQVQHGLALMKLSKVLGWAGKLGESYDLARRAAAMAPDNSSVQYQAGLTAHMIGQRQEAVDHYRRAIVIQPDADLPRQNLGVLLKGAGQLVEAAEQFRLAIQYARSEETRADNAENLADTLVLLGFVHYQRAQFAEAVSSFAEADDLVPGKPDTLMRLGLAQMASGQRTEAVASLEKAAAISTSDPVVHNRLAIAYASNGQMDRAQQSWQEAVRLHPEIADAPDAFPRVMGTSGIQNSRSGPRTE